MIIGLANCLACGLVTTGLTDGPIQPWIHPQDPKNREFSSQKQLMVQELGLLSLTTRFMAEKTTYAKKATTNSNSMPKWWRTPKQKQLRSQQPHAEMPSSKTETSLCTARAGLLLTAEPETSSSLRMETLPMPRKSAKSILPITTQRNSLLTGTSPWLHEALFMRNQTPPRGCFFVSQ